MAKPDACVVDFRGAEAFSASTASKNKNAGNARQQGTSGAEPEQQNQSASFLQERGQQWSTSSRSRNIIC
jgi:hypothetical protein